ncbi:hypothetical protein TEA_014014 [Camellia sinensis var. sinensis]|uniref:RNA polymerase II C-terminal domain phosphatase-like n=1 Tax=Camellia sinensis var. sinensis TaxID=542762 RepID=A0A4V3WP56_CAMSN|nr:hypothetical protein TEA_014014 [Camellia sinensis var. sinensis]
MHKKFSGLFIAWMAFQMSLVTDSPVHSSSSDDFAAFLDGELGSNSDTSPNQEDEDEDEVEVEVEVEVEDDIERIKRRKVASNLDAELHLEASVKKDICAHPGFIRGLCMICGAKVDDDTATLNYENAVPLKYIHKDLWLGFDESARLRNRDLKNLFRHKKLYLVLDLDHTLLNSTRLVDLTPDEEYLKSQTDSLQVESKILEYLANLGLPVYYLLKLLPLTSYRLVSHPVLPRTFANVPRGSLFRLDSIHMMTKLRPFVHSFLKEASNLFEMYIYTMGERPYALEMANLLDPGKVYFSSRVIAKDDGTQRHQKGLDVLLGQESAVLILDDTEPRENSFETFVWKWRKRVDSDESVNLSDPCQLQALQLKERQREKEIMEMHVYGPSLKTVCVMPIIVADMVFDEMSQRDFGFASARIPAFCGLVAKGKLYAEALSLLVDLDVPRGSLFRLDSIHMMTKLRPFVHSFLKEASNLFEMYIYTMGERPYALEMANLLDPGKVYFSSRVIAKDDGTQRHQKGLDVLLGQESAVLILDDTEPVWGVHKENLILMERYHFFASSCRQFGFNCKSLSEQRSDESEPDGALASIMKVLKQIHSIFFDTEPGTDLADRDVRQVLKAVRKEVLKGCKVVFSRVIPTKFQAENHYLWKMAEQLGAECLTEVDPSVTHVVSNDTGTEKSRWAVKEKKFLVHPRWIEAANYLWQKQPEENFPVDQTKKQ